eukprot:gnl/Spiro4/6026_TR3090_c0_g1_i1.p1 gnl/Spiro4/6026_TR3090_c0_g1~~gnl/Spiro4/6026_TR3090_c0_g1_i1.p1  ORF type:complete len:633 (-),score=98.38 gnl/Spiro4/6026_TR3090_c0_g1_i1:76-1974(-)
MLQAAGRRLFVLGRTAPCVLFCSSSHVPPTNAQTGYEKPYVKDVKASVEFAHKRGSEILHDPVYNKGLAFPHDERERLGLRGLLPPRCVSLEYQVKRALGQYFDGPPTPTAAESVTPLQVRKWEYLSNLKDRNESLYYKLLVDNFVEMAPIVYTPTVGWACANYHKIYRKPRGMFFSALDKGEMAQMAYNWHSQEVDAIVVTDGSRILGLGDLGIGGLGISIGKLDLYVAAAGFHPRKVLPVVLDVGTNNASLINDPTYLGLKQPRLTGREYVDIVDEFVKAVMQRWPKAVLQFEDFSTENALNLLNRYRHTHCMFNDDIQGTAATALAGIYGALKVQSRGPRELSDLKFVVSGAGSAGMGVVWQLHRAMVAHGLPAEAAFRQFYLHDINGAITRARKTHSDAVRPFARPETDMEGLPLAHIVNAVKPDALIGLTGVGGTFTPDVLRGLAAGCQRPILFPMSNPTHKMECTAELGQQLCEGRAIFASGSPQPDVSVGGRVVASSQANNMYCFPGVALGARLLGASGISDGMMMAAAEAVASALTPKDVKEGRVYPQLKNIRDISVRVAYEVMKCAINEGLHDSTSEAYRMFAEPEPHAAGRNSEQAIMDFVYRRMFVPDYNDIVYLPPGIME